MKNQDAPQSGIGRGIAGLVGHKPKVLIQPAGSAKKQKKQNDGKDTQRSTANPSEEQDDE